MSLVLYMAIGAVIARGLLFILTLIQLCGDRPRAGSLKSHPRSVAVLLLCEMRAHVPLFVKCACTCPSLPTFAPPQQTGEICLNILKKEWSPAWSLQVDGGFSEGHIVLLLLLLFYEVWDSVNMILIVHVSRLSYTRRNMYRINSVCAGDA